jgi:hypothetical protein
MSHDFVYCGVYLSFKGSIKCPSLPTNFSIALRQEFICCPEQKAAPAVERLTTAITLA